MRDRIVAGVLCAVLATGVLVGGAPATPAGAAEGRRYLDPVFDEVTVTSDIVYGRALDEHDQQQSLHLDLYQPTGDAATARPVIVLAHGGYFAFGDKGTMREDAMEYARRGYVAASIQYRMDEGAGLITYPPDEDGIRRIREAVWDMQAAVRWARRRAATYRLDPGKVSVGGYSAGAVMSVVAAVSPDDPGDSGNPGFSSAVCTAVARAGAGQPDEVGPGDAGALFLHGDQDFVVPYVVAKQTEEAMEAAGLPARLVTYPGQGHGPPVDFDLTSRWLYQRMVLRTTPCGESDPTAPAFVQAAYADLIGRAPTSAELTRETTGLDAGFQRTEVLTGLVRSPEWIGSIVRDLYQQALGRTPDSGGLAFWVEQIRSKRRTVASVAVQLHGSAEAVAEQGSVEAWVTHLYDALLGRSPAPRDVTYWSAIAEAHGTTAVASRIHDATESRRARVVALYQHLLGRTPDRGGQDFWGARIGAEGDLAVARALAASGEYGARAVTRFPT